MGVADYCEKSPSSVVKIFSTGREGDEVHGLALIGECFRARFLGNTRRKRCLLAAEDSSDDNSFSSNL